MHTLKWVLEKCWACRMSNKQNVILIYFCFYNETAWHLQYFTTTSVTNLEWTSHSVIAAPTRPTSTNPPKEKTILTFYSCTLTLIGVRCVLWLSLHFHRAICRQQTSCCNPSLLDPCFTVMLSVSSLKYTDPSCVLCLCCNALKINIQYDTAHKWFSNYCYLRRWLI